MHEYPNSYYCLILVKYAKQFANTFADISIIIFQDDKVKIRFEILVIDCTFYYYNLLMNLIYQIHH